jgi:sugar-specific transcriptional regulator TrmB
VKDLLLNMGLNSYQASLLTALLLMGEAKVSALAKISGVPNARTYEILNELVRMGLVSIRPGRPATYVSFHPREVAGTLILQTEKEVKEKLREIKKLARKFTEITSKIYLTGRKGPNKHPLIHLVSVGSSSEKETKNLYGMAKKKILILSQAYEYFPRVSRELSKAVNRGVEVKLLLKNPRKLNENQRAKQKEILDLLRNAFNRKVEIRFVDQIPLRGCLIDPENNGRGIFLVEEAGVPFEFREAAITSNLGLIKTLTLMFNFLWVNAKALKQSS